MTVYQAVHNLVDIFRSFVTENSVKNAKAIELMAIDIK